MYTVQRIPFRMYYVYHETILSGDFEFKSSCFSKDTGIYRYILGFFQIVNLFRTCAVQISIIETRIK